MTMLALFNATPTSHVHPKDLLLMVLLALAGFASYQLLRKKFIG